jgi:hypothetical protein
MKSYAVDGASEATRRDERQSELGGDEPKSSRLATAPRRAGDPPGVAVTAVIMSPNIHP